MFCSAIGRDCACRALKESALVAVPGEYPDDLFAAIISGIREGLGREIVCQRLALDIAPWQEDCGRLHGMLNASRYVIIDITAFNAAAAYVLGAARSLPGTVVILIAGAEVSMPPDGWQAPVQPYPPGDCGALSAIIARTVKEAGQPAAASSIAELGEHLAQAVSGLEQCRTKYDRDIPEIDAWAGRLRMLHRAVIDFQSAPNREARVLAASLQETADYLRSPAGAEYFPAAAPIADGLQRTADAICAELDSLHYGESFGAIQKILLSELGRQAAAVTLAERAYTAFDAGDNALALDLFDRAIEMDPRYPQIFLGRGRTRADLRQYRAALADFNRALKLDPESVAAYCHRGGAHRNLKEFDKSLADYNRLLELLPGSPHAHNGRGIVYGDLKDYRKAVSEYSLALQSDPHYYYALINRANIRWELREYELALDDLNKALSLDPCRARIYSIRADCFRSQTELDKALADINRALELEPHNIDYLVSRGNIYTDRKQVEKALADYNQAISLQPDSVTAYNNRGAARMQTGDLAGALADFAEAIRLDPEDSQTYNNRAILYCEQRQYQLAIDDYRRALAIVPEDIISYLNIAELDIILNRLQDALTTLQNMPAADYSANDKVIYHYLNCAAKRLLGMDTGDDEQRLTGLLPAADNINWSFAEFERWLSESGIDPVHRAYIINLTEILKEKTIGQ